MRDYRRAMHAVAAYVGYPVVLETIPRDIDMADPDHARVVEWRYQDAVPGWRHWTLRPFPRNPRPLPYSDL